MLLLPKCQPRRSPERSSPNAYWLLNYNSFLGRLSVGKVMAGTLRVNQDVLVTNTDRAHERKARITKIYRFKSNQMEEVDSASCGDVVAIAGVEDARMGETVCDPQNPQPLEAPPVDPPTVSTLLPNDSPFSGKDGDFVTSRHIKERLERELLSDVALQVEPLGGEPGFAVSGRGELHLSVLIEKMRHEGYELQVTRPKVIFKEEDGQRLEPYEEVTIDVSEESMGRVMELLGERKAKMVDMSKDKDMNRLKYEIPTRGLLGFRSEFLTETRGMGTMNSVFLHYGAFAGEIKQRKNGVLVSMATDTTTPFALFNLQDLYI